MPKLSPAAQAILDRTGIPPIGLGTSGRVGDDGIAAILTAIEIGYRHIDSAQNYGSEGPMGEAIRRSGLPQGCFGIVRAACDVVIDMREEGIELNAVEFGGRILEALMTRYDALTAAERAKQIEYLGRYGEMKIRKVARRLKADLVRAA